MRFLHPTTEKVSLWHFLTIFTILLPVYLTAQIPDVPPDASFLNDYGGIVHQSEYNRIGQAQQTAYEQHNTPIIVVTIPSMAAYGYTDTSIEGFAMQWFNKWKIGTLNRDQDGANKGILLLVSVGDRKARIELGADWGRKWDPYCQHIMDRQIIPQFKQGNFSGGIAAGVEQLSQMASLGPESVPPTPTAMEQLTHRVSSNEPLTPASLIPASFAIIMLLAGVGLIVLSIFFPNQRKYLLIAGFALIALALLTWVILVIIAIILGRKDGGSSGFGSGGFSSGGGFSGGFSGGGGASGSW